MLTVSVIIPAFNSARFIGAAIDSVLQQTCPPNEIIVVDDGSTDQTPDITRAFPVKYLHQENAGPSAARNRGIQESSSELVAFLDADDVWLGHKLAVQTKAFETYPDAGFSFSTVWNLYEGSNPKISHAPYYPPELVRWLRRQDASQDAVFGSVYKLLLHKNFVATSSMVVRRDLIERVGIFDRALRGCEDYDYWIRLARLAPAVFLQSPVSRYRIVDDGLSGAWEARYERFYDTFIQVMDAHRQAYPSITVRRAMGAALANHAYFCLIGGSVSAARSLSWRSLWMYPTSRGIKTFFEASWPRAFSAVAQVAHKGRSEQR